MKKFAISHIAKIIAMSIYIAILILGAISVLNAMSIPNITGKSKAVH